jgi:hypothetical protein
MIGEALRLVPSALTWYKSAEPLSSDVNTIVDPSGAQAAL